MLWVACCGLRWAGWRLKPLERKCIAPGGCLRVTFFILRLSTLPSTSPQPFIGPQTLHPHPHPPQLDLGEVYSGVPPGVHRYALRSMITYYGRHYQAFVYVPEAASWLMFDDARVSCVGSWADVRRKCVAGCMQPSVLFYGAAS